MAYPRNIQPTETWLVGIMLNENTIMSRRTTPPRVDGSNTFTKHPPCARQVTWANLHPLSYHSYGPTKFFRLYLDNIPTGNGPMDILFGKFALISFTNLRFFD